MTAGRVAAGRLSAGRLGLAACLDQAAVCIDLPHAQLVIHEHAPGLPIVRRHLLDEDAPRAARPDDELTSATLSCSSSIGLGRALMRCGGSPVSDSMSVPSSSRVADLGRELEQRGEGDGGVGDLATEPAQMARSEAHQSTGTVRANDPISIMGLWAPGRSRRTPRCPPHRAWSVGDGLGVDPRPRGW